MPSNSTLPSTVTSHGVRPACPEDACGPFFTNTSRPKGPGHTPTREVNVYGRKYEDSYIYCVERHISDDGLEVRQHEWYTEEGYLDWHRENWLKLGLEPDGKYDIVGRATSNGNVMATLDSIVCERESRPKFDNIHRLLDHHDEQRQRPNKKRRTSSSGRHGKRSVNHRSTSMVDSEDDSTSDLGINHISSALIKDEPEGEGSTRVKLERK